MSSQIALDSAVLDNPTTETTQSITPMRDCVKTALAAYFSDLNGHKPDGLYDMVMEEVESPLFEVVLQYTRGNQSKAAALLGINRGTLRKKLKQYGLL